MATLTPLNPEEIQTILQRWEKDGLADEEKEEFLTTSLQLLADQAAAKGFGDNIAEIAQLAAGVDRTFGEVHLILWINALFYGPDSLHKWISFEERWRACLRASAGVADATSDVLRRFDQVYLTQVINIETESDRDSAEKALRPFISELENDQQPAAMSRQFLDLKRDIEVFVAECNALQPAVASLLQDIERLDGQIKRLRTVLPVGGALFNVLAPNAGSLPVLASLLEERQKKVKSVADFRLAMSNMVKLAAPSEMSIPAWITPPDIDSMLERLLIFAEIWTSVRSQAVQFCEILQGGLNAAKNPSFISQVELAQETCTPLRNGLQEYKQQLEKWI